MTGECPDAPGLASEDGLGPVLDENELKALCANLSVAEAREFVWLCIVDTELHLTDIIARRTAGDLESMAEIAHGIARQAAKLGAIRVHVLALRLETACRGGKAGPYSLIGELSDAWTKVGDSLCAWLAQRESPLAA
jgi:HPt (histidine-containing phosphotransfer) domain-containing protein